MMRAASSDRATFRTSTVTCRSFSTTPLLISIAVLMSIQPSALQRTAPAADSPALTEALDAAGRLPRIHSLLVSWRGTLVAERYFNGTRATRLANIKSASKGIISALGGISIERGLIKG